jgi:hypothetical protein
VGPLRLHTARVPRRARALCALIHTPCALRARRYSPVGVTWRRVAPNRLAMLDRAALGAHPCYYLTRLAISALQALQLGSLGWEARFGWSSDALDGLHALSWARLRAEGDAFVVLFLIASGAAARASGDKRRARVERGWAADSARRRARALRAGDGARHDDGHRPLSRRVPRRVLLVLVRARPRARRRVCPRPPRPRVHRSRAVAGLATPSSLACCSCRSSRSCWTC